MYEYVIHKLDNDLIDYENCEHYMSLKKILTTHFDHPNKLFIKKFKLLIEILYYGFILEIPFMKYQKKTLIIQPFFQIVEAIDVSKKRMMDEHCHKLLFTIKHTEKTDNYLNYLHKFTQQLDILNKLEHDIKKITDGKVTKITDTIFNLIGTNMCLSERFIENYNDDSWS